MPVGRSFRLDFGSASALALSALPAVELMRSAEAATGSPYAGAFRFAQTR